MKQIKLIMMIAVLTVAWGCSSDDEENNKEKWTNSIYVPCDEPTWAVDWTAADSKPSWQNPDPTLYDSNMFYLVKLDEELKEYSTENDIMAMFMGDKCRGVSARNVLPDGNVAFLLHVKGKGSESGEPLELRYYCDKLHHTNILPDITTYAPNNIITPAYTKLLSIKDGSSKYPVSTTLTVVIPKELPFTVNDNDKVAVFVGEECRGIGQREADIKDRWQMSVYGKAGETALIRYYSAEKKGAYTFLKTVELKGEPITETLTF